MKMKRSSPREQPGIKYLFRWLVYRALSYDGGFLLLVFQNRSYVENQRKPINADFQREH